MRTLTLGCFLRKSVLLRCFLLHCFLLGLAVQGFSGLADAGDKLKYPLTKQIDHVDTLHGKPIPDPYRWLEDDVRQSKEVADWVAAENKVTADYLAALPQRDAIKKRLTELWNYEKFGAPFKAGGRYFYFKNDGLQNQSVLYKLESLNADPVVFIDPNSWSKDGTVALGSTSFSDDGRYVAYSVADAGSDWNTWRIIEVETGRLLADELFMKEIRCGQILTA